jgi:DNA-binding MarR family transcriptional regulator
MDAENTHLLAAELRQVLTRLMRKLRKLSPANTVLSQTERSVLVLLEHQQLLSSELALMEKITPQSMGQILNHLSALDLIGKNPSPTDKRKVYISLSPAGRAMIQQVRGEREEWLFRALTEVCTDKEQQGLKAAIDSLTKLVEFK